MMLEEFNHLDMKLELTVQFELKAEMLSGEEVEIMIVVQDNQRRLRGGRKSYSLHESDLKARWRRQDVQEKEEGEGASMEKALDIVENSQNAGGKVQVWGVTCRMFLSEQSPSANLPAFSIKLTFKKNCPLLQEFCHSHQ